MGEWVELSPLQWFLKYATGSCDGEVRSNFGIGSLVSHNSGWGNGHDDYGHPLSPEETNGTGTFFDEEIPWETF